MVIENYIYIHNFLERKNNIHVNECIQKEINASLNVSSQQKLKTYLVKVG